MTDSPTGALSERDALKFIAEWRLPTVQIDGVTMSYESAYGSNGARGYMRDIARAALASRSTEPGGEAAVCQYSKEVDMPEYRCAVKCQYAESIEMEARLSRAAGVVAAQAGQSHQEFVEWLCNGGFVQMALSHFGVSTPPPISASKEAGAAQAGEQCDGCSGELGDAYCARCLIDAPAEWLRKVIADGYRTDDERYCAEQLLNIATPESAPAPRSEPRAPVLTDEQIKAIYTELWRSHSISVTDYQFDTIARAILAASTTQPPATKDQS